MDKKWYSNFIKKYHKKKVKILGSEWTIEVCKEEDDDYLAHEKNLDGYCAMNLKLIVVRDFGADPNYNYQNNNWIENGFKEVLRHEIMHAFYDESGLSSGSFVYGGPWAKNEEMIDWLAIQTPKIFAVLQELDLLGFKYIKEE